MIHGIASLGPGEGSSPTVQARTAAAHVAGGFVGGTAMAASLWLAVTPVRTLLPAPAVVGLFAIVVVVAAGIDLRLLDRGTSRGRQVPATWRRRYGHYRGFMAFGAVLGMGVGTFVSYALTYVAFAAAAVLMPLGLAAASGAVFGIARAGAAAIGSGAAPVAGDAFKRLQRSRHVPTLLSVLVSSAVLAAAIARW
jgi:hypothetical protein